MVACVDEDWKDAFLTSLYITVECLKIRFERDKLNNTHMPLLSRLDNCHRKELLSRSVIGDDLLIKTFIAFRQLSQERTILSSKLVCIRHIFIH